MFVLEDDESCERLEAADESGMRDEGGPLMGMSPWRQRPLQQYNACRCCWLLTVSESTILQIKPGGRGIRRVRRCDCRHVGGAVDHREWTGGDGEADILAVTMVNSTVASRLLLGVHVRASFFFCELVKGCIIHRTLQQS
jgi:hypothetical protein